MIETTFNEWLFNKENYYLVQLNEIEYVTVRIKQNRNMKSNVVHQIHVDEKNMSVKWDYNEHYPREDYLIQTVKGMFCKWNNND